MPATLTKEGDALVLDLSTARGSEFKDALAKIKEIPGRRYDPESKLWSVPADSGTADRVIHAIQPAVEPELSEWIKQERVKLSEALTTPLPDDAELLTPLSEKLYPYQRAFVDLAVRQRSIICADDMGLGKTVQGLATISEYELRNYLCQMQGKEGLDRVLQGLEKGKWSSSGMQGLSHCETKGGLSSKYGLVEDDSGSALHRLRSEAAAGMYGSGSCSWPETLRIRYCCSLLEAAQRGSSEVRDSMPELSSIEAFPRGAKLLVCPNSVKGVWAREIVSWLGSNEPHQIIDGSTPKARHAQLLAAIQERAWVIVNYEQLRVQKAKLEIKHRSGSKSTRTIEVMKEPLFELPFLAAASPSLDDLDPKTVERARTSKHRAGWLAAIADEAHRAKNRRASQSKGLHRIDAELKIAATGTPIMNTPDEAWSILHWLWPEEYTSYWRFYETYVDYTEGYFGKVITGARNPDALRFELRDRLVRRTKANVLDLPEKTRVTVPVELSKNERGFYKELAAKVWIDLRNEAKGNSALADAIEKGDLSGLIKIPHGAARMVRLQQALEHPANIDEEARVQESSKMNACAEIILDNANQPHVVFCKFKPSVSIFAERLREKGLRVAVYTGDVDSKVRTSLEDQFQNGELDVIVGTHDSMREGITLTASSVCHFLTRSWVPGWNEQAEDRLHRVGQHDPVTIYIYEVANTVDDGKVRPANRLKEAIVSTVLEKDEIKETVYS